MTSCTPHFPPGKPSLRMHARSAARICAISTAADPKRWQNFASSSTTTGCSISRGSASPARRLPLLFDLARAVDLPARIAAMFRGDPINTTEQRAVLHTALRSDFAGPAAIQAEVRDSRQKLADFAGAVRARREARPDGQEIQARREYRHRRLGSRAVAGVRCAARRVERRHHAALRVERRPHAARGSDPQHRSGGDAGRRVLEDFRHAGDADQCQCGPGMDRRSAGRESAGHHFVGRVDQREAMDAFGIAPEHRFTMWDWVGGRYSVWSAIGLDRRTDRRQRAIRGIPQGRERHRRALHERAVRAESAGAHGAARRLEPDASSTSRRSRCCPTTSASRACRRTCSSWKWKATASRCRSRASASIFATAPVVWGEPGSNAQHSFFQMLHQGTPTAALDFIAPLRGSWGGTEGQDLALQELLRPVAGLCLRAHGRRGRG